MTSTVINSIFITLMEIIAIIIVIHPLQKKSFYPLRLFGLSLIFAAAGVGEQLLIASYIDNFLLWLIFEISNLFIIAFIIYTVTQSEIRDSVYYSVWSVCLFQLAFTASCFMRGPGSLFAKGFWVYIPIYGLFALFLFKDPAFNYSLKATSRDVFIAALTHFPINLFNHILFNANNYDGTNYLLIFATVFSYACCMFVLYLHRILLIRTRLSKEMSIINELWQQRQAQFEITSSSIDFLNKKTHDLMHALSELYKLDDKESRTEFLDDLSTRLKIYDAFTNTGNKALDTILSQANLYCESKGIELKSMICQDPLDFLDIADLYTMLNNALENAFSYVLQIEDPDYRIVNISVQTKANLLLISVENVYQKNIKIHTEPSYGLKSISHVVKKYNGQLSSSCTEDLYKLTITIPLPN